MKTRILDCTLRDGGYYNSWNFGETNISNILKSLVSAQIDIIEIGFLNNKVTFDPNITRYQNIQEISKILPKDRGNSNFVCMINFGEYDIKNIPSYDESSVDGIRIAFHKKDIKEALEFAKSIKEKGYKAFIQPMLTLSYSDREFLDLIDKVNEIEPFAFYIVDSFGTMRDNDVSAYFDIAHRNLKNKIVLGFHAHNSLQLSFPNSQTLLSKNIDRELIIDSSVFGMGRGAGNLCTELITQYINDNYNGKYDIVPILKIIDECINPIFMRTPWGYSVPYYLAATNHCHPNYAKYLADKQTIPVEMINSLLASIPATKKSYYDEALIKQLYLDKLSCQLDESKATKWLSEQINTRKILVLAPGRSIASQKELVDEYIKRNNPFVVSLNFEPSDYKVDMVFVSNMKRFLSFENIKAPVVMTSNINCDLSNPKAQNIMALSYSKYLNSSAMYDNVALMFFKVLLSMGVDEVAVAGLDGFSNVASQNYYKTEMINSGRIGDIDERNEIMKTELAKLKEDIKIEFVTESGYVE